MRYYAVNKIQNDVYWIVKVEGNGEIWYTSLHHSDQFTLDYDHWNWWTKQYYMVKTAPVFDLVKGITWD